MINFSIIEIEAMVEEDKFSAEMKPVVEILLSAVNDWSDDPVDNFYDYDLAVQNFIMKATTKRNIELALSKVDISKDAWKAESLSSLLEVYDSFKEDISLIEIIEIVIKSQSTI